IGSARRRCSNPTRASDVPPVSGTITPRPLWAKSEMPGAQGDSLELSANPVTENVEDLIADRQTTEVARDDATRRAKIIAECGLEPCGERSVERHDSEFGVQ